MKTMAILQSEFNNFCKKITIDKEADALRDKRELLKKDIEKYLPDELDAIGIEATKSDFEFIHQGSYIINTTITNRYGPVDLDYAVIVPIDIYQNSNTPKIKKSVKNSLTHISTRTVKIKEPCVTVSYHDGDKETTHIDFPVYASYNGSLYLARGKEYSSEDNYKWEIADPRGLNDYFLKNLNGNDELRNVIRLIKKWKQEAYRNKTTDHEIPPSVALTILACQKYVHKDSMIQTVYETLNCIKNSFRLTKDISGNILTANLHCNLPVAPYSDVFYKMRNSSDYMIKFYNKLDSAVRNLDEAIQLDDEHEAGLCIQKVFGDEFEIPKKQARYTESYNNRESSFG